VATIWVAARSASGSEAPWYTQAVDEILGVVSVDREVLEIETVERLVASQAETLFGPSELAFAGATSDPARRLAASWAAKLATLRLLGGSLGPRDVEVQRGQGAPRLWLSDSARVRLRELGANGTLVSLTHERRHAAALVALIAE
jgi:phosphopantetheinyl transferase (holo-ACP synthase)